MPAKSVKTPQKRFLNRTPIDPYNLPDLQESSSNHPIPIHKVGTRGGKLPIKVYNKDGSIQNTIADMSVYVSLNEKSKGINMSRLDIILNKNVDTVYHMNTMRMILDDLVQKLGSTNSYLKVSFPFFTQKYAPVSKEPSLSEHYITLIGKLKNGKFTFDVILKVLGMSSCPCSREISEYGSHDQRSYVEATVRLTETSSESLYLEDMIDIIDSTFSCPVWNVLKRDDERYVTMTAYENAKFSEDIAREAYAKLSEFKEKGVFTAVGVVCNNEESIHSHNATAIVVDEEFAF